MVITVIGADRAGLVEALSRAVAHNDGNWNQSHMAELAGTFAGIVVVTVPESAVDALAADLEQIESNGLLHISIADDDSPALSLNPSAETEAERSATKFDLKLVGQDHPGIVHEISQALASRNISIEELETAVVPAPMGGHLFQAEATLEAPPGIELDDVQDLLEAVAQDLMVDLDLSTG